MVFRIEVSPHNDAIENTSPSTTVNIGNCEQGLAKDDKWVTWVTKQFKMIADDGRLTKDKFKKALGLKKSFFAERFFVLFDADESGDVDCQELINVLRMLKNDTAEKKLKFLFEVFDVDGNGTVDQFELKTVLQSCMEESGMILSTEDLEELTSVLFADADIDNNGEVTFEEFQSSVNKYPDLSKELSLSAVHWFEIPEVRTLRMSCCKHCSITKCKHNVSVVVCLIIYIIITLGLSSIAVWQNFQSNGFVIAARICGMNLNLNCCLILVFMLKHSLNIVRSTRFGRLLPLDHNVLFHQVVGAIITVLSAGHMSAHIGNAVKLSSDNIPTWRILFTDVTSQYGLVSGSSFISGWILILLLIVMITFALPAVRKKIYQAFYYTHFLCIPFWILLILHCQHFWMWFILPGTIFTIEKIYRIKWIKQLRYGETYIEKVTLLPCGVTHIEITRPKSFIFKPGDYMYLQIPDISPYEFHPFTISSAPENKDYLWLHIRTTGNWTKELYSYMSSYDPGDHSEHFEINTMRTVLEQKRRDQEPNRRKSLIKRLNSMMSNIIQRRGTVESIDEIELSRQKRINQKIKRVHIRCFLDGPFGTASRDALQTEHAILIGAGIGVTPMASILQSILYQIRRNKRRCPQCTHCWYDETSENGLEIKKVDFVWINRDQRCFQWFLRLLNNLEIEQDMSAIDSNKLVDLHLYMTSAIKKTHVEGIGLQMALDLVHSQENKDFFTSLRTKTKPGRPDWDKFFRQISTQQTGKKKVFFCGPKVMADTIKEFCTKYGIGFAKENF